MKTFLIFFVLAITLSANAQVEVSGVVKNFTDSAFYITQIGGFNNFTRVWQDTRVKVPIDKNKTFKVIVPEESIGTWYIKTGNEKQIQMFDFVKGENQILDVDFSKPYPLHAIGKNEGDFNYSAFLRDSVESYYSKNDYFKKTRIKNIDSVLFYRKKFASYKLNLLKKFRSTHVMSDTYCKWLQSKYSYEPFERTLVENIKNRDSLDDATISELMQKGINDEYAALNTGEYNDLVDFYIATRLNRKSKKLTLADRFNYVV